jgi:hypothetical protein
MKKEERKLLWTAIIFFSVLQVPFTFRAPSSSSLLLRGGSFRIWHSYTGFSIKLSLTFWNCGWTRIWSGSILAALRRSCASLLLLWLAGLLIGTKGIFCGPQPLERLTNWSVCNNGANRFRNIVTTNLTCVPYVEHASVGTTSRPLRASTCHRRYFRAKYN